MLAHFYAVLIFLAKHRTSSVRFFLHWFQSMAHFHTPENHLILTHQEQEVPEHKTKMISSGIRTWGRTGVIPKVRNTKKPDRMSGFFTFGTTWVALYTIRYKRSFGKTAVKVEPSFSFELISRCAPCCISTCLTMARPKPVPPVWRLRALSTR